MQSPWPSETPEPPATQYPCPTVVDVNEMAGRSEIAKMANDQAKQQLDQFITGGLIVQNGAFYTMQLSYQNGKLMVNGKPFDAKAFK